MKMMNVVKTAVWIAFLAGISAAGIKYVAVVETEVDIHSGASDKLTKAEVRLVTAELRREAVNNLPRDKYNIMTSETVMAQGSAKLEECAEENCVIALGAKIGADYIVRGIISRLQTMLTLTVEIYETEDGNLVASSDPVRSEKVGELIEKAAVACANMYKKFANEQNATPQSSTPQQAPKQAATYTVTVNINPTNGGYVSRSSNKAYYDAGEMLTLTATPYNGYAFTGWSGASTSTKATLKGPITGDLKLTANFQYIQQAYTSAPNDYSPSFGSVDSDPKQTYTLTTNVFPTDWGIVTRNPNKSAYTNGETVTVTATAHNGCTFAGWTGETEDRANRVVVITMDGNKALTANFHGQRMGSSSAQPDPEQPQISRILDRRKSIEINSYLYFNDMNHSKYYDSFGGVLFGMKANADITYLYLDIIELAFTTNKIKTININQHVLGKYPIYLNFVKVSPLLGFSMSQLTSQMTDIYSGTIQTSVTMAFLFAMGGKVEVELGEISYASTEFICGFGMVSIDGATQSIKSGGGSAQSFKISYGFDIGSGEKFYYRPELSYQFTRNVYEYEDSSDDKKISAHSVGLCFGIGWKLGHKR